MNNSFGGYSTINAYVKAKIERFASMECSFASLFEVSFQDKENILFEESKGLRIIRTTYGEAYDRVLRYAGAFRRITKDLPDNSVIGLSMDNGIDWIIAFWMILLSGHRPLLINLRLPASALDDILSGSHTALVVSDSREYTVNTLMFGDIAPDNEPEKLSASGSELFVMSSGTSSHVKLCAYTAEEFFCQIKDSYYIITKCKEIKKHYEGSLKLLTFLPFYHIFGLAAMLMWFSFFARTFVALPDMAPTTIVNTVRRHKVTHIFAVPLFWEKVYEQAIKGIKERGEATWNKFGKGMKLAKAIGDVPVVGDLFCRSAFREVRENIFGESICFMITGGSRISSEVLTFFNSIGYHLADGYGMSEIGITSVELSSRKKILNSQSIGEPLPSVEYRTGEDGGLLVKGKSIARYIIEDGQVRPREEWFATRDLAVCDDGKRWRITGRQDELIVDASGENLNPNLIEPFLHHDLLKGVCIVGSERNGKIISVLVASVDRHITSGQLSDLKKSLREQLDSLDAVTRIGEICFVTDNLIKDQEFKLNRVRIADDLANGRFRIADPEAISAQMSDKTEFADTELLETLRQLFAAALGKEINDPDADFFVDEGGTSLDYFALTAKLQENYGISFPNEAGSSLSTIRGLYYYIEERLK